ncbi:MAG: DUF4340 domain-containing protein [Myxococcales bacterium]|nr:DUF4340 domain-containing protein [Myxococcales bacterium]
MTNLNKILAGLMVAQLALVVGVELRNTDQAMTMKTVTVLEGLDPAQVDKLAIWGPPKRGDGPTQESVVLAKVNGAWTIDGADGFPADDAKVKDLLDRLKELTSRTVVLEGSKYHDKLEVSPEKFQRKVVITAGGKDRTLYVGTSPSFKNTHVRLDGSDQVLLVNEFGPNDLGSRAWHWVDRKFLDIPADDVWAIQIQNAQGSLQLEKDPATKAWAVLGLTEPLNTATVEDLVRKARTLNLETPAGKTSKPEYGLDAPLATVTLTTGTSTVAGAPPPTTEKVVVQVGKKLDAENQYFVKTSKSDYVVRVAAWGLDPLVTKGMKDLIKKD